MSVELKEGEWAFSGDHPVRVVRIMPPMVTTEDAEGRTWFVDSRNLEPLPRTDPRHPEHRPERPEWLEKAAKAVRRHARRSINPIGWRYHCPSEEEVRDNEQVLVSTRPSKGRSDGSVTCVYIRAAREHWDARFIAWMPLPAPASPTYEPPRGWVEIDLQDEATWPKEQDAGRSKDILAEDHDGDLHVMKVRDVRNRHSWFARWCTTQWVREATA